MDRLVLYAPNVHTGGGFVLLRSLLTNWSRDDIELSLFMDDRTKHAVSLSDRTRVYWVKASIISRLNAELELRRQGREGHVVVLCFHGLPPVIPNNARVIVFQQNRNYLGLIPLSTFSLRTRIRLTFERLIARSFQQRVSTYIVQTPSMKRDLVTWCQRHGHSRFSPHVLVLPFMDDQALAIERTCCDTSYDFIYVADGEAHKNHRNLLRAWTLLAEDGLRPTLALTLTSRDCMLRKEVASAIKDFKLAIVDLGDLPREKLLLLYSRSRALIFPSTSESFGLPLIEASQVGMPILAGELDYVRDVCVPSETFDPSSPVSIARAVKRFLGSSESPVAPSSPVVFWEKIFEIASTHYR